MQARRLRLTVGITTALLLVALAIGTHLLVERMRDTAELTARQNVQRVARVIESTINRQFLAVDGTLAGLPAVLGQVVREERLEPGEASRLLRELNFQNFNFRDMVLVRPDGQPWASALAASRGRALPLDPERLAEARQIGAAVVSGPARNPLTGEWALFFLRAIALPGTGELIAVAEVPLTLIATLLAPIGEMPGLRMTVERADGTILAILPHDEPRMGRRQERAPTTLPIDGSAILIPGHASGDAIFAATRPTLYREVFVVASYEADDAFAAWTLDRRRLFGVASGIAALLLLLALALNTALRQREKIDAERARARAVLESAIETMPDGFVMFDADDRLVICNHRYRDLYSVSAPFIVPGALFEDIIREGARLGQYPQAGDDHERFIAGICAWHRSNQPSMERLLPDGRWILVTERRTPDGGTVGIRTDITALKHAMTDLAQARDAAAAATEAKSRFLARMSHELRTPLNGVLGLAQALARDPRLSGEQQAQARTLETAGRHLVAVANDVLDLAKVEAGRLDLKLAPAGLRDVLESCATLIRPAAEDKHVRLTVLHDPELPPAVQVDRTRMQQLLLNLLSNAVKFTPPNGAVELIAQRLPDIDAEGRVLVRLEVRDSGPGVPEEQRRAVFGDFVQLDSGSRMGGTGLGLAIAAGIAGQMDGRIGCGANPIGQGAMFWVEVPLLPAAAPNQPTAQTAATSRAPLLVLVADDVPANLAVARALLESAGHEAHCVNDGALAVQALISGHDGRRFDVVLMDVMMPGMDGLEATRRIRTLPGPLAEVPILAVTASAFAEDVQACREAGMNAHLAKPIEREALLAALDCLTEEQPETQPAQATTADFATLPLLTRRGNAPLALPGLDTKAALRLAPEFISEIRAAATALAVAAPEAGPEQAVIPMAHRLAGAAATLGANRLAAAARHLQAEAPRLPPEELLELRELVLGTAAESLDALDDAMARLKAEQADRATA
jgi:signal transduction histidine kinase/DNA-binding response OmpR family regulator